MFFPNFVKGLGLKMYKANITSKKNMWHWVSTVFNQVDVSRIQAVGPDRACAEWVLRCGGSIKWKDYNETLKDYNALPPEHFKHYIEEIDATESCVMDNGFIHLRDLKYLTRLILHRCYFVEDEGLIQLSEHTRSTLQHLQVSSCSNITFEGVKSLKELQELKTLLLFDLDNVDGRDECFKFLKGELPKCTIQFPCECPEIHQNERQ